VGRCARAYRLPVAGTKVALFHVSIWCRIDLRIDRSAVRGEALEAGNMPDGCIDVRASSYVYSALQCMAVLEVQVRSLIPLSPHPALSLRERENRSISKW
jgi:hypothetical protein